MVHQKRLRELREERGWTQQELGRRAGVTGETISRIERGRYSPRFATLFGIAKALGVKLEELLRRRAAKEAS